MSFLRLLPQISVPPIEPRGIDESFLAQQFLDRLKACLQRCSVTLQSMKNWTWLRYLPSGQAISVEVVGYADPALVILGGREQGSGRACTLLAHQSSIQVLVSIESIPSGSQRRVVTFEAR